MQRQFTVWLLLLMLIAPVFSLAQQEKEKAQKAFELKYTYSKRKKLAQKAYDQGKFYEAIDYYKEMSKEKPNDMEVAYQLAQSYRKARDYVNAAEWYHNVVQTSDINYPLARYYRGKMLKRQGEYKKALGVFQSFIDESIPDKYSEYEDYANQELENCRYGMKEQKRETDYIVQHLDSTINRPYTEFAPAVSGDSLFVFSSLNNDAELNDKFQEGDGLQSHIYAASREDSQWVNVRPLPKPVNDVEHHSGNGSFSADGKRFYFTKCKAVNSSTFNCDIYVSTFVNGFWYSVNKLSKEVNSKGSTNTHPAVAPHPADKKDILYFVSDREGGQGKRDIWYAVVEHNGQAEKPTNLGETINTPKNEHSPFYSANDSTLYFSSRSHKNLGGYDILKAQGTRSDWQQPDNLGMPFNSSADDIYYTFAETDNKRYLVSNRPGTIGLRSKTCCDDIFAVKSKEQPKYFINANIYEEDDESRDPIEGARIQVMDAENYPNKVLHEDTTTGDPSQKVRLQPDKDYKVRITKPNYFAETFDVSTKGLDHSHTFDFNVGLEKMDKGKVYTLNKIYYDFGSAELREESKEELNQLHELLKNNPNIIIEVRAHTDSIGSQAKNLKLSQKRAENVVAYLVEKGIDEKRLKPKGYGEIKPVATNKTEEGRQKNRRTEFKITGKLEESVLVK